MKIFILEAKGEVLTVLTHSEDKTYADFKAECVEAGEDNNNDYYTIKDAMITMFGYQVVDVVGGFEVNKKKNGF